MVTHWKRQQKLFIELMQKICWPARRPRALLLTCAYRPHAGRSCAIPGKCSSFIEGGDA